MLADRVRRASGHNGPWPSISVWHGTADMTVDPVNMEAIIAQWYPLHEIERSPTTDTVDGHTVRRWRNREGTAVIKAYSIKGMGHGTPVQTTGPQSAGCAQPFMVGVGISSTWHIAKSWNLIQEEVVIRNVIPYAPDLNHHRSQENEAQSVGIVIERALRAAGLIK